MDITLNYTELMNVVERSLSIIGKRSVDENGNALFSTITLSSREKEILRDFLRSSFVSLATALRQFVSFEGVTDAGYQIRVTLYDSNPALEKTTIQAIKDHVVDYTLYSWFTVTSPTIAQKYLADANAQLNFLDAQVFHRQRPDTLPNPLRTKTDPTES